MRKIFAKYGGSVRIAMLLICISLIMLSPMSGLYARYSSSSSGTDSARVAAFAFDLTDANDAAFTLDTSALTHPGASKTYTFKLSNGEGAKVSEVAIGYKISITDLGNLPFTYTLTRTDKNAGSSASGLPSGGGVTATDGVMPAGSAVTHTYELTVTWPASEKSPDYSYMVDMLTVKISSAQID